MVRHSQRLGGIWKHRAGLSLSDRLCFAHWAIVLCGLAAFAFDGSTSSLSLGVLLFALIVCMTLRRQRIGTPRLLRVAGQTESISRQSMTSNACRHAALIALRRANRLSGAPPSFAVDAVLCSQEVMAHAVASFLLPGVAHANPHD
jgi:hypothetical protein